MNLLEFREHYINEINSQAIEESRYKEEVFIDNVADMLINDYAMISDLEHCYFSEAKGTRAFKSMYIDAGSLDLVTNSLNLLIGDYNIEDVMDINSAFINSKSQLLINFFENVLKGFFIGGEYTAPVIQLANDIRKNFENIYKIHLFIVSTNKLKESIKTIDLPNIMHAGKSYKVELDIIDIVKIHNTKMADTERDDIIISTEDFGVDGIPCIKADIDSEQYEAYLAVVPGKLLSDIYKKYGSQLLSGNVRSFLQVRGAVNKGIRATVLNEKDKFFTYNNGISTTAKSIDIVEIKGKGLCISSFCDLQIINGGQTTASLASAAIKDNADLDGIFVQMKLTIVKVENPDLVRNISKYANSQNKVTAADLNSNHQYYVRIEELSRRVYAPTVNNQTYQTIWFFERSRGQYDQPKMKMSKAERGKYERINPKNQKVTKTDLAKWLNSADMHPFDVAWGAEVNSIRFQINMEKVWSKDNSFYNEYYFKELISKGIVFKAIEKIISTQDWYKENKANRAQLVTYTFAKLISETKKIDKYFNYISIWDKQSVPEYLVEDISRLSKVVFDVLNSSNRPYPDIREYCKRPICWDNVNAESFTFSSETQVFLKDEAEVKGERIIAKREQKLTNNLTLEIQIFKIGSKKWKHLMDIGLEQKVLNFSDEVNIKYAIDYCKGIKQMSKLKAKTIWVVKEKLEEHQIFIN